LEGDKFMPLVRTSETHPLRIDKIQLTGGSGYIGMTLCPGKKFRSTFGYIWDRDFDNDLQRLADEKADGILTIMETDEIGRCKVPDIGSEIKKAGLRWWHLSVPDGYVLSPDLYPEWETMRRELVDFVMSGKNLVVHCRGGLGRTGTFVSVLLMDLIGITPEEAIAKVRQARHGTVENVYQEDFVKNYRHLNPNKYFKPLERETDMRIAGCLLGGAIGDAFGYVVEFDSLERIRQKFGEEGIRELKLTGDKAIFSDDTQMTLFTLQGLLNAMKHNRKPDREKIRTEIYRSYLDWLKTQGETKSLGGIGSDLLSVRELFARRAPGNTCLSALMSGKCGTMDRPLNDSKGCGGVMRVAPIGLVRAFSPEDVFMIGADSAAITHGHPSGYWPAAALAMIIRLSLDGLNIEQSAREALRELQKHPSSDETIKAITKALELAESGLPATGETVEQLGGGWVGEEALAIGLYAALKAKDFREALRISANHGGDSDSTALITGEIIGTLHGTKSIPEDWIDKLELASLICNYAEELASLNRL